MDTLFVLGQESRLRILRQAAARVPGCAYLCAWAAIPAAQPLHRPASSSSSSSAAAATSARLLCCIDAWLCDGGDRPSRLRALFDAYRGSLCTPVAGCVPGWAYKDGRAYMELPAHDLTTSSSLPVQQQFYQEAGIQMAAFMGCESGEIEIGMSTTTSGSGSPMSLESTLQQVFSEDFFQHSLLEELLQMPPTRPSSPSSSLPSASMGSPTAADVSTSLPRTMAVRRLAATTTPSSSVVWQQAPPSVPQPAPLPYPRPPLPLVRHGPAGNVCFPSADADDAAMAQAMLDVISASSSSALPTTPSTTAPPTSHNHRTRRWPRRRGAATAFRAYNAALAPRATWRQPGGAPGQRMIKMGISILRRMHMLRFSRERTGGTMMVQRGQEGEDDDPSSPTVPTSSQLNHMISERRRRERLNESFEALRGLLPPGSKKDKATVLAKTLDYMNILVAQIADLEARNRSLESRVHHPHHRHTNGGTSKEMSSSRSSLEQQVVVLQGLKSGTPSPSERVQVHVTTTAGDAGGASTSSSSAGRPSRETTVSVRVHARAAQGDVAELVARTLAVIKGMGCFTVMAVDAGRPSDGASDVAQATFTLQAKADEFDVASLREAVRKAAEDSGTPTPTPPSGD